MLSQGRLIYFKCLLRNTAFKETYRHWNLWQPSSRPVKHFCHGFTFPHMFQHKIDWVSPRIHGHPFNSINLDRVKAWEKPTIGRHYLFSQLSIQTGLLGHEITQGKFYSFSTSLEAGVNTASRWVRWVFCLVSTAAVRLAWKTCWALGALPAD